MKNTEFIPFGRPNFSDEEIEAVTKCMRSGWVGMGSQTIAFEQELATFMNAPHVITVNSCTSALFLSLKIIGVGPGDEVIVPSLTWCATANAALYLGATLVFCDIAPDSLCVTPETIAVKLTSRTKAVIPVHFGGMAVDVNAIRAILPDEVIIVEDAAHALGSLYPDGTPVGSSGNLTCFSFYANKNLSTGDGGAIAVFDTAKAKRLCSLRQSGMPVDAWKRYSTPRNMPSSEIIELGYKMNYTDLQACVGRIQLKRQPEFQERRLAIASLYHDRLVANNAPVSFQKGILDPRHARHLFTIRLDEEVTEVSRDELLLGLRAQNVGASIHYPPLHHMALYNRERRQQALPNTEAICARIMTLPISSSMTLEDICYVIEQFNELIKQGLSKFRGNFS